MNPTADQPSTSDLAAQVARLWPHREHEANPLLALLCNAGLHRWRRLDLDGLVRGHDVQHCFRCSRVKIDGITYEG